VSNLRRRVTVICTAAIANVMTKMTVATVEA
jgi:hypothetical protein